MGFGFGLDTPRTPAQSAIRGTRYDRRKYKAVASDKERQIPAAHLAARSGAFSKFQRTAGLPSPNTADLNIINIESAECGGAYQLHQRPAGGGGVLGSRKARKPRLGREIETPKCYSHGLSEFR